ncbi:MAG TPA: gamma subclass chorismate mutase AroQ [Burkholderiales bacterium]|nr:gamma subclass chorismate mutase AroQ [Burkholderiales bacterium]
MKSEAVIAAQDSLRYIAAALFFLLLAGCATQPPAAPDVGKIDRVLVLVAERLSYMDDVARNKWNSGAPIEDLPREREIIDSLGKQAAGYGLDAGTAREFFRAQIEASKIIQRTRFAEWRAQNQPPFKNLPDLRDKIRPALDALTPELMNALAGALPVLRSSGGAGLVDARAAVVVVVRAADIGARDEAIGPLVRIANQR